MTHIPFGKCRKMHRDSTLSEVTFLFPMQLSRVALTYKIETFQLRWSAAAHKARRKRGGQRSWRCLEVTHSQEHPAQCWELQVKEHWNCAFQPALSWFRMVLNLALSIDSKAVITGRWSSGQQRQGGKRGAQQNRKSFPWNAHKVGKGGSAMRNTCRLFCFLSALNQHSQIASSGLAVLPAQIRNHRWFGTQLLYVSLSTVFENCSHPLKSQDCLTWDLIYFDGISSDICFCLGFSDPAGMVRL